MGQLCVVACVLHGVDMAHGAAPALSTTRSAIAALDEVGPGRRAAFVRTCWTLCSAWVGRHISVDAPTSRHHSSGQGARWRAGDRWGGSACGAACVAHCDGGGVGVGVGVRPGAGVGSDRGRVGGAAVVSGGTSVASVSCGTLGGAGSVASSSPGTAGGWSRWNALQSGEWQGAAPIWAASPQSRQHAPPANRGGRLQPRVVHWSIWTSGWGGGGAGHVAPLSCTVSGRFRC